MGESRGRPRDSDTHCGPNQKQSSYITHNHSENRASLRTQSEADANLSLPPQHQVCQHSVESDHRQKQRKRAEES